MSSLERKIKRNELRNQYKNKGIKKEFRLFQVYKYGLAKYAKMQHKTQQDILKEDL